MDLGYSGKNVKTQRMEKPMKNCGKQLYQKSYQNQMKHQTLAQKSLCALFALIFAVLLVLPVTVLAKTLEVQAVVNRTQITPEETIQLQVVVDGGKADIDLSAIKDFEILSKGTSSSRSYVNGVWSHEVRYSFVLAPVRQGKLTIPALSVTRKKETATTNPIAILVSPAPASSSSADLDTNFFAKASVSTANPVAGQALVYTFSLFSASPIVDARLQPPSFEGFSARELEDKRTTTNEIINGRSFRVTRIFYLLIPSDAGQYEIGPARVVAQVPTGKRVDPFGSFGNLDDFFNSGPSASFFSRNQTRRVKISSPAVPVTVTPLPPCEGDGKFSGLIGHFSLDASLDKKELAVGDSSTLTFVLSGRGNIMDAGKPAGGLPETDAFTIYDDDPEEEIRLSEKGYEGKKIFQQALVALKPGKTTIPGASLVYFDVEQGKYVTLHGPSFEISVSGSPAASQIANSVSGSAPSPIPSSAGQTTSPKPLLQKEEPASQSGEIQEDKPIYDMEKISRFLSSQSFEKVWFFAGIAAMVLVILVLLFLLLRFFRRPQPRKTLLIKEAKKAIQFAQQGNPGEPDSWKRLQVACGAAIRARAGKGGENLTAAEITLLLSASGLDEKTLEEILAAVEKMDAVRFGAVLPDEGDFHSCLASIRKLI